MTNDATKEQMQFTQPEEMLVQKIIRRSLFIDSLLGTVGLGISLPASTATLKAAPNNNVSVFGDMNQLSVSDSRLA